MIQFQRTDIAKSAQNATGLAWIGLANAVALLMICGGSDTNGA
jgi:hypothetical protein